MRPGMTISKETPNGPAAAAILAAGLGSFIIGLDTVLAQASPMINHLFTWWPPAGPLSGKTGMGVMVWLLSWAIFHSVWRDKEVSFRSIWSASVILIVLANILVFPPVFEAFGH